MQYNKTTHPVLFAALRRVGYLRQTVSVSVMDQTTLCVSDPRNGYGHYFWNTATGNLAPLHMGRDAIMPIHPTMAVVTADNIKDIRSFWHISMNKEDANRLGIHVDETNRI